MIVGVVAIAIAITIGWCCRWCGWLWSNANQLLWFWITCERLMISIGRIWWMLPLPACTTEISVGESNKWKLNWICLHAQCPLSSVSLCSFFSSLLEQDMKLWHSPETCQFTTIVWSVLYTARWTQWIFQIWIDLNLFGKFGRFYFNKCRCNRFHIRTITIECDASRSNWIFMFIRIDAWNDFLVFIFRSHFTWNRLVCR